MLEIKNLTVKIEGSDRYILRDVSFEIQKGEIFGIAGESGSGKSVFARTVLGLTKPPLIKTDGKIIFKNKELISSDDFKSIRAKEISLIFQNPTAALNPVFTIGEQMIETILIHRKCSKEEARKIAIELLDQVEIDFPEERLKSYPFNLSGGMNQRVMIALALASNPSMLIADEPTTALDVTTQTKIINLLLKLQKEKGLTVVFISHDLSLLEKICDKILIFYAAEVMELLGKDDLKKGRFRHPYTVALRKSNPDFWDGKSEYLFSIPGTIAQNSTEYDDKCIFFNRCYKKRDICGKIKPEFKENIKCFYPEK